MSAKKKTPRVRVKKFTAADVELATTQLSTLTEKCRALRDAMREQEFDGSLKVDGGTKMIEGLGWITDWITKTDSAFLKAISGRIGAEN